MMHVQYFIYIYILYMTVVFQPLLVEMVLHFDPRPNGDHDVTDVQQNCASKYTHLAMVPLYQAQ